MTHIPRPARIVQHGDPRRADRLLACWLGGLFAAALLVLLAAAWLVEMGVFG